MSRKKIVFIIDIKPALSESSDFNHEDNWKQIRFSILRLLTYFGGKHKSGGGKVGTGPLWGFKFYKSSGGHLEYGNHHFFDFKLKDFESFEEEFNMRIDQTGHEQLLTSPDVSSQLSCALAEVVAGFQWERPDFYSPVKAKRNDLNRKQEDIRNDAMNNYVFLFTPCPSCCGVSYFSKKTTVTSSTCLKSLLMKEELYRKIVFESKISLHWIDTGQNEGQAQQHFHETLSETMTFFSGSLVPLKNLSYWWVQTENESTASIKSCQPAPFSIFIDSIISKSANSYRRDTATKLSIDVYNLALSLKGSFQTSQSNSSSLFIPIILRNATIKSISRRKFPQKHMTVTSTVTQNACAEWVQTKEPDQQRRTNKSDQQEKEVRCYSMQGNIAIIKSVFKSSAALNLLQDIQESYYCSYDQMNSDPRSIHLLAYQQLLKILKAKKLILVLQLNHPEGGHQVNACLQPWTNMSAIVTIISKLAPPTSSANEDSVLSAKHQTTLIEKLVDNIQKKIGLTKLARKDSDRDAVEELNKVGEGPPASSFMQSLDYWFYDLPSHAVNSSIHENIQRIKGIDAEAAQRANQRSSILFGKLKKHYEQQRNAKKADKSEDKASKPKRPVISSPKMKSLAATRSEQLLVKSRAVKQKKKSEEEFKEKEKQKVIEEADRKWKENNGVNIEEEGCPFDDFDISKECQDLPSIESEDFAEYIKKEITDVLQKDLDSCAAVARRLSKNLVIYLHKMNQGKEVEEIISPNGFLVNIFEEIASLCSSEQKSSKVSRHLLYVLMELEIAALLTVKDSKKSSKQENSDPGGHQISKDAADAEIPSKMENIINPAKSDPKTDPGKSDREIDKSKSNPDKSNPDKSGSDANKSESDESNLELEKQKAIAEKIVQQLRPVIFLEDPVFLAKYLNTTILPRFKMRIPKILREIYDRLGQETPNEIVTPSKRTSDGDESFETIIDHDQIDSVVFSDYGSNNPSNQSGVSLRRFSSISDNMASKRQIVVPLKKAKKASKKKVKKGFKAENNIESEDEVNGNKGGWCRNLFETGLDGNVLPVKGSKKRKLHRRYSEMAPAVKDTPARKQKRHFFWKRQHQERRKTDGITDITVIGESPLKDCHIAESPVKTSGASRFLSRSQSFNCKTSPRRFYAFQRRRSIIQASPRKPFGRSFSCLTESGRVSAIKTPDKNHITERPLNQLIKTSLDTSLDKTITNEKTESFNGESPILFATPRKGDGISPGRTPLKREPTFLVSDTPKKEDTQSVVTPRKRNSSLDSNLSKDEFTSIMDGTPQKRRRFSEATTSTGDSFYEDSSDTARPKPVLDLLDIASQSSSGGFDVRISSKPVFYSEDSMDWVAMFGNDQSSQVSQNKIEESPLPTVDSVPSFKGSENGSLTGNSPNLFTPIREGKQPFSSPFLSASSLETLENAPILSPRLRGSKSKRESTCRKRIEITNED